MPQSGYGEQMALSDSAIGLDASFPAQPTQVAAIRRAVTDVAVRHGAGDGTVVRLELAISEAATNAVLHAYRDPGVTGAIHVTALVAGGALDVSIRDYGIGMSPRSDSPGLGLGLPLIAGECDRFEIRTGEGGGTELLLRFELAAPDGVPAPEGRFVRKAADAAVHAGA